MKTTSLSKPLLFFTFIFLFLHYNTQAQSPTLVSYKLLENNGQFEKLEIGFQISGDFVNYLSPNYINPYNPDEISIQAVFLNMSTGITYDNNGNNFFGFYMLDYLFNSSPSNCITYPPHPDFISSAPTMYNFRLRFAPPQAGVYRCTGQLLYQNVNVGSFELSFEVVPSDNKGYIRKNGKLFACAYSFDNGDPYFPTGSNLTFYDKAMCRIAWENLYLRSIDNLASVEGNFARVLMCGDQWRPQTEDGFIFNIEWGTNAKLGNYDARQDIAFLLDNLIEYAHNKNVYLQFGLHSYADVEINAFWDHNPYKQILGTNNNGFYTDVNAQELWGRKLRYILARWGYSTNIFAWELFMEAQNSSVNNIDFAAWINTMSSLIKSYDGNHLIMTSGDDWFDMDPASKQQMMFSSSNIDILDHHCYTGSEFYNIAQLRREQGIKKITYFNKPLMIGEFGYDGAASGGDLQMYEHNHLDLYRFSLIHSSIWSSSFSGTSGTASCWIPELLYDLYPHIKPLRVLINEMDLTKDYEPISMEFQSAGPTHLAMSNTVYDHFNLHHSDPNAIYDEVFDSQPPPFSYKRTIDAYLYNSNNNTYTLNNSQLVILGLQNDEDIFGWIQKKDNFWWKLPHIERPSTFIHKTDFDANCSYTSILNLPTASSCNNFPLENARALIKDVCNGEYVIDYYSAYPNIPLVPNGAPANGGIIPSFTRRVFSTGSALDIKIPPLHPLEDHTNPEENPIYAPDYGYHIRKVKPENFMDVDRGPYEVKRGNIETFFRHGRAVTKIFTVGKNDNLLKYYYWDHQNNSWVYGNMNQYVNSSQAVDGDIAVNNNEDKVFYRGIDGRMHQYYFSVNQWYHDCVPLGCSSPSNQNIAPDSHIEATDDQIFYKGTDNKVHMYYYTTNWNHTILNPSASNAEDVIMNGDIEVFEDVLSNSSNVFFVTTNGSIGMYTRNGSNAATWTFSVIGTPSISNEIAIGKILPVSYLNENYCFYVGYDHRVQYYHKTASGWNHGYISNHPVCNAFMKSNLIFHDGVLYYADEFGYIHRYYWDNIEWRHALIVPCPANRTISGTNIYIDDFRILEDANSFVYVGPDNTIREMYNAFDCEKCYGEIDYYEVLKQRDSGYTNTEQNIININTPIAAEIRNNTFDSLIHFTLNNKSFTWVIYPNPASSVLHIEHNMEGFNNISIRILNSMGIEVLRQPLFNKTSHVDISNLPRGMYICNILNPVGTIFVSKKIIVQ